jgi:hypothetical protein
MQSSRQLNTAPTLQSLNCSFSSGFYARLPLRDSIDRLKECRYLCIKPFLAIPAGKLFSMAYCWMAMDMGSLEFGRARQQAELLHPSSSSGAPHSAQYRVSIPIMMFNLPNRSMTKPPYLVFCCLWLAFVPVSPPPYQCIGSQSLPLYPVPPDLVLIWKRGSNFLLVFPVLDSICNYFRSFCTQSNSCCRKAGASR